MPLFTILDLLRIRLLNLWSLGSRFLCSDSDSHTERRRRDRANWAKAAQRPQAAHASTSTRQPSIAKQFHGARDQIPGVGRKNHYGSKSRRGTEVAAILYPRVETANVCLRCWRLRDSRRHSVLRVYRAPRRAGWSVGRSGTSTARFGTRSSPSGTRNSPSGTRSTHPGQHANVERSPASRTGRIRSRRGGLL